MTTRRLTADLPRPARQPAPDLIAATEPPRSRSRTGKASGKAPTAAEPAIEDDEPAQPVAPMPGTGIDQDTYAAQLRALDDGPRISRTISVPNALVDRLTGAAHVGRQLARTAPERGEPGGLSDLASRAILAEVLRIENTYNAGRPFDAVALAPGITEASTARKRRARK